MRETRVAMIAVLLAVALTGGCSLTSAAESEGNWLLRDKNGKLIAAVAALAAVDHSTATVLRLRPSESRRWLIELGAVADGSRLRVLGDQKQRIELGVPGDAAEVKMKAAGGFITARVSATGSQVRMGFGGTEILFVGVTQDGVPQLIMRDKNGAERLVIGLDSSGTPHLRIIDKNGSVTRDLATE